MATRERSSTSARAAAFPAFRWPWPFRSIQFTLIDGTQKKIRFVDEGIAALDIRNATALAARAENMPKDQVFDVVVARAVGTLADLVHNVERLVAPGGRLLAMKGRLPEEEISRCPRDWRAEVTKLRVPGLDAERHLCRCHASARPIRQKRNPRRVETVRSPS